MAWEAPDGTMGTARVPQPSLGILRWAQEDKIQERVMACWLAQLCHTLRKKKTQIKSTRPKTVKANISFALESFCWLKVIPSI